MTTTFTVNQMAEDWQQANMPFAAYAASKHVPLGGTFELTPRCSLKCKMCYVRLDPAQMDAIGRELTAREWISLASDAIKAETVNLLITGGEPEILTVVTWQVMAITAASIFLFGIIITALCANISVNRFLKMKAGDLYKI